MDRRERHSAADWRIHECRPHHSEAGSEDSGSVVTKSARITLPFYNYTMYTTIRCYIIIAAIIATVFDIHCTGKMHEDDITHTMYTIVSGCWEVKLTDGRLA